MDKTEAIAVAEKSSGWLAELTAWLTLLDAWGVIGISIIVIGVVTIVWRMNRGPSAFSITDSMIDQTTGHTSYLRVIIFCSFIGAWGVALWYMVKGDDVRPYVLTILGIFVTNILGNRVAENFDPRVKAAAFNLAPEAPPTQAPVTVGGPATVTVNPPEPPEVKTKGKKR